jgi:adenine-specific DNA-methyltransferase
MLLIYGLRSHQDGIHGERMADRDSLIQRDHVPPLDADDARRRTLGIYYTPRSAAAILARWAIRGPNDTILEPSFGGCTILEAAIDRLKLLGCRLPAKRLFGFDVDQAAFSYLHRLMGHGVKGQFVLRDFLTVDAENIAVDTVIANPPFVSYHRMNSAQRRTIRAWRERHMPSFAMTASSWAYFLAHSMSFLKLNGRLAFVLPSAATSSDYAEPLMDLLAAHFANVLVCRVNQPLFIQAGADERTVILLAEGYRRSGRSHCERLEHSVSSLDELGQLLGDGHLLGTKAAQVSLFNSESSSAANVLKEGAFRGSLCRLGDLASVSIGEVVGDTEFLVKSKDEWEALKVPERHLRALVTRTRQLNGIQITSLDVSALYGGIPWLLVPPNKRMPKCIRNYLNRYPRTERLANSTFAKRDPWYAVSYDESAGAFIGAMSHDSPKVILNSAGISCANGLYKIISKPGINGFSSIAAASLTSSFKLSAEIHARIRGSGALKLEPSDVANLIVPSANATIASAKLRPLISRLDQLVRRKELFAATREADDALLIKTGALSSRDLSVIRDRLQDLRAKRLATKVAT